MTFAIETGIPVPAKPAGRGASKYPFYTMGVGDSFVVDLGSKKSWGFIFASIQAAQMKSGREFTTRLVEDGIRRVWRTA